MARAALLTLFALVCGCSPTWWGRAPTRWDRTAFERDQAVRVVGCAELGFSVDRDTSLTTERSETEAPVGLHATDCSITRRLRPQFTDA